MFLIIICNPCVCLSFIRERRRFAPSRQAHAHSDSEGRRTEKRGRAEMPAEPLSAFPRFSPLAYFPFHCLPYPNFLSANNVQFVLRLFFSSEFAFSCGDCRIILSKVNGRKILFSDFPFSVDFCFLTF